MGANGVPGAQAINRAIDILEQFSEQVPTRSLKEVAASLGLSSSTTHRLLRALESREMLFMDPSTKEYRLGPAIPRLASPIMNQNGVTSVVAPFLREIQRQTGESASYQVRLGYDRVCVLEYEGGHHVQYKSGVGRKFPLVAGSAGKAFVAFLNDREIEDLLTEAGASGRWPLRERTRVEYMTEVNRIRHKGYAVSSGEVMSDGAGVGAAVLDLSGQPVGAVNVGAPATRFRGRIPDDVGQIVHAAVNDIERALGLPSRKERGLLSVRRVAKRS